MENNYISLYRKYRPKKFSDVAGHQNVKEILVSEITNHSLPGALLFVGQRGTGKTSVAKILAKTINCINVDEVTGEACDKCDSCKMANSNSHPDIFEIDAASNNGVDEIRNINSSVFTLPISGAKKVFIIDEVHMLTSNAFNAFLKTLEEPPTHVVFILATTEFQKIPATILSRCQVFNFKKIGLDDVKERMKNILSDEDCSADEDVLNEIYYLSDGSLRDALNYLEQLAMISKPNITIDKLTNLFSVATKEDKMKIILNIFSGQSESLINFFENSMKKGLDVEILILQLVDIVKEIIEYRLTSNDQILKYLNSTDLKSFTEIETKNFFNLVDVLASVYEKTNKTNISYQYLIVTLLKWIGEFGSPLISVPTKVIKNNEKVEITSHPLEAKDEDVHAEPVQEIIMEPFVEKDINIESELTSENNIAEIQVDEPVEPKNILSNEPIMIGRNGEDIMFEKNEIENTLLRIISKVNYVNLPEISFDHKKIMNVLLNAKNHERKKWTSAFENLYTDGNQLEDMLAIFYESKVVAACPEAIIIYISSPIYSKIANNLLQDSAFRNKLFEVLNLPQTNVFVIEKETWSEIKEEYTALRTNNVLPTYDVSLFENFYDEVIRHTNVVTNEENEILARAKEFFGNNFIKVVD